MSGIYEDVVKNTIREFIHGDGKNVEAHREEVISKYLQDLLTKGQLLKKSGEIKPIPKK